MRGSAIRKVTLIHRIFGSNWRQSVELVQFIHDLLFLAICVLQFGQHHGFLLLKFLSHLVNIFCLIISVANSTIVIFSHGVIIVNFVYLSCVFGLSLIFVTLLSLSLLLLMKLWLIRLNGFTNFLLLLPNFFSLCFIRRENIELICTNVIFALTPIGIYLRPIFLFFFHKFLIHLLFHSHFLIFNWMHLRDEVCLSFSVPDSLLSLLLFFIQFDQSRLELVLLMVHQFEIIFGLHHLCVCILTHWAHTCHQHLSLFRWDHKELILCRSWGGFHWRILIWIILSIHLGLDGRWNFWFFGHI